MKLVVDANILFAALIKHGETRRLMLLGGHELYMPEYALEEFRKHFGEIQKKTGASKEKLIKNTGKLIELSGMKIVPLAQFSRHKKKAEEITPDRGDTAYLALAMELGCPLWSNDSRLGRQKEVPVISTRELLANK